MFQQALQAPTGVVAAAGPVLPAGIKQHTVAIDGLGKPIYMNAFLALHFKCFTDIVTAPCTVPHLHNATLAK